MVRTNLLAASLWVGALGWLAACSDRTAASPGGLTAPAAGFAVVNSDYVSSSISLLDAVTGQVTNGDCLDSGTRAPGVTLALSGDVVLPSQPQAANLVVAIDRTNSALTWIDPTACTPLRQLDVSTGFYANPHDVISAGSTKAYVTRYGHNAAPTADPDDFDDGDDLLVIDPSIPKITGRIDLSSYAVGVDGAAIQPGPDHALLIGTTLYVALTNLSADFKTAAHGRVVAIDTATDRVTQTIDLADWKNCTTLSYVAARSELVVACGGSFSDADQAAGSGIISIDLSASPPAEVHRQPVAPFGGRPVAGYAGAADDGALGFAVTSGDFGGPTTDRFWALDTAAGTATQLAVSSESFTFGGVLVDPDHDRVYMTDANPATPRVQVYRYTDPAAPALELSIDTNPSLGLPPRAIVPY